MKHAAIYHFTNKSEKRPKIYRDQLKTLEDYAVSMGFAVDGIYCDMSNKKCEHEEFDRFMSNCNQYDALFTKDFYHISKNTGTCIKTLNTLKENGVLTYTIENGYLTFEQEPLDKPLTIATYYSWFGNENELRDIVSVQNNILKLFSKNKTNWIILDQYIDKSKSQTDEEQTQLQELIANKDKYDLLLVHCMNDINWRTSKFCKIRDLLQMDIYSLQEGLLKYRRCKI